MAAQQVFSFPVTWTPVANSHGPPGITEASLYLITVNGVTGYNPKMPVTLIGTSISNSPYLIITPAEVDFPGIGLGSGPQLQKSQFTIINKGAAKMTFLGFAWHDTVNGQSKNLTTSGGSTIIGTGFTSTAVPSVGSTLAAGASLRVPVAFGTSTVGLFSSMLTIYTDGGDKNVMLVGSASTAPVSTISVSVNGGAFSSALSMDFGTVNSMASATGTIQICNNGGGALSITQSVPPNSAEIGTLSSIDLREGQNIGPGTCATGGVEIFAAMTGPNRPAHSISDNWVLNTNGLNADGTAFGVHTVSISATIQAPQIGPLMPDGSARFSYLGCYYDGAGRQLVNQIYSNTVTNENALCQSTCFAAGYAFAGTEYSTSLLPIHRAFTDSFFLKPLSVGVATRPLFQQVLPQTTLSATLSVLGRSTKPVVEQELSYLFMLTRSSSPPLELGHRLL